MKLSSPKSQAAQPMEDNELRNSFSISHSEWICVSRGRHFGYLMAHCWTYVCTCFQITRLLQLSVCDFSGFCVVGSTNISLTKMLTLSKHTKTQSRSNKSVWKTNRNYWMEYRIVWAYCISANVPFYSDKLVEKCISGVQRCGLGYYCYFFHGWLEWFAIRLRTESRTDRPYSTAAHTALQKTYGRNVFQ